MATDIVGFFLRFVVRFRDSECFTLKEFISFFREEKIEFIFYCGVSPGQVVADDIVEDIFGLCCAYLYIPYLYECDMLRTFALLMLYMLWFTQPYASVIEGPALRVKIDVSLSVMNDLLSRMNVRPIAEDSKDLEFVDVFSAGEGSRSFGRINKFLSLAEAQAVLCLHKSGAWQVVPYSDVGVYLAVLCKTHDRLKLSVRRRLLHESSFYAFCVNQCDYNSSSTSCAPSFVFGQDAPSDANFSSCTSETRRREVRRAMAQYDGVLHDVMLSTQ